MAEGYPARSAKRQQLYRRAEGFASTKRVLRSSGSPRELVVLVLGRPPAA